MADMTSVIEKLRKRIVGETVLDVRVVKTPTFFDNSYKVEFVTRSACGNYKHTCTLTFTPT